jgi:hypothetical protein
MKCPECDNILKCQFDPNQEDFQEEPTLEIQLICPNLECRKSFFTFVNMDDFIVEEDA